MQPLCNKCSAPLISLINVYPQLMPKVLSKLNMIIEPAKRYLVLLSNLKDAVQPSLEAVGTYVIK